MGQSWSSDGSGIQGAEQIEEMYAELPAGFTSRAQLRLDANRKYPEAGDKTSNLIKQFFCAKEDSSDDDDLQGLIKLPDVHKFAGTTLVSDEAVEELSVQLVEKALDNIVPGIHDEEGDLAKWIAKCLSEPIWEEEADQVITKATTIVRASLHRKPERKLALFDVRILLSKQVLQGASSPNILLGAAVTVASSNLSCSDENILNVSKCPAGTGTICFSKVSIKCDGVHLTRYGRFPALDLQNPAATSLPTRPRRQSVKGQAPRSPTITGRASGSKGGASPNQWTLKEKELLVHFYWEHYRKDKLLQWPEAAELWCRTFQRKDTQIQLESNRRRFEKLGVRNNGTNCVLCHPNKGKARRKSSTKKSKGSIADTQGEIERQELTATSSQKPNENADVSMEDTEPALGTGLVTEIAMEGQQGLLQESPVHHLT